MTLNSQHVFNTPRLLARDWSLDDAEQALLMYKDPDVVRHIGMQPVADLKAMHEQLTWMLQRKLNFPKGMGGFAAIERASGELIGNLLLKPLPDVHGKPTLDIEIGWHLRKSHWGQGFASEGGKGLLRYGFETLGLSRLYAVVEPENTRSQAVAQRLGMTAQGRTTKYYSGLELELFDLERHEWRARRPG